jgi:hypothetical protein
VLIDFVGIMKKKILTTIVLIFLFIAFTLGAMEPQSDSIVFTGFIKGEVLFKVETIFTESVDLLSDVISPTGPGIEIGKWILDVKNPPVVQKSYTVTYEFAPLVSEDVEDTIDFILIEKKEDQEPPFVERSNGDEFYIEFEDGRLVTTTRILMAKLTDQGATTVMTAAAADYASNIKITLSAE